MSVFGIRQCGAGFSADRARPQRIGNNRPGDEPIPGEQLEVQSSPALRRVRMSDELEGGVSCAAVTHGRVLRMFADQRSADECGPEPSDGQRVLCVRDHRCERTRLAVLTARFQDAELVSLGVGHHKPRHVPLTDIGIQRAEIEGALDQGHLMLRGVGGEVDVLSIRAAVRLHRRDEPHVGVATDVHRAAPGGGVDGQTTFDHSRPEITEPQRVPRFHDHGNAVGAHAPTVIRSLLKWQPECRHTVVAPLSDAVDMTENRDTMTTSGAAGDAALAVWLTMWNSDGEIARRICTDDFRIHFLNSEADGSNPGDDVVGADQFAEYLDAYRQRHPDVVFTEVARATDGLHGRLLWDVRADGNAAGGVDVFDVTEDGLIREVWSVGGTRPHRP